MAFDTRAIGKTYATVSYLVGREKIREFAAAVSETDPLYFDVDRARAAGHADVVAPPMFAAVYASPSVAEAIFDPEVGLDLAQMLHAEQVFDWDELVVAGDEISTTTRVTAIDDHGELGFYVFESVSTNEAAQIVSTGRWTCIARGGE